VAASSANTGATIIANKSTLSTFFIFFVLLLCRPVTDLFPLIFTRKFGGVNLKLLVDRYKRGSLGSCCTAVCITVLNAIAGL